MKRWSQALGLGLMGIVVGACTPVVGTSFQTLGVPDVTPPSGLSAVILGWEYEEREGWSVNMVRVDDRARSEWDSATQQPVVMYLDPGERTVQIMAEQRRSARSGGVLRRYRSRPTKVHIEDASSSLCVIRVTGKQRRRPRIRCTDHGGPRLAKAAPPQARENLGKRGVIEVQDSSDLIDSPYPARAPSTEPAVEEPPSQQLLATPYAAAVEAPEPAPRVRRDLLNNPYEEELSADERIQRLEERLDRIERSLNKLIEQRSTP